VDRIVAAGGDVWAKLDAGTPEYYARVCGTRVPFAKVLTNLAETARRLPLTLQTCLPTLAGEGPTEAEIDAYVGRVREIQAAGGTIRCIQLYTVARPPAQSVVGPLPEAALRAVAERVETALKGVPVAVFA